MYRHIRETDHLYTLKHIQIHILVHHQETLTVQDNLRIQEKEIKHSLAQEYLHIHVPEVVHMFVLLLEQVQVILVETMLVTTQDPLRVITHVRL